MADPSQPDPSPGNPALFQTPFDLQVANTPNFINAAYSTPSQRAQLYSYANELMKPQPVKNGWQGMASVIRSLLGGYTAHLGDQYEAGAFKGAQGDAAGTLGALSTGMASGGAPQVAVQPSAAPPAGAVPSAAPAGAVAAASPPSGQYDNTQAGHEAFIRDYATSKGIDPGFASAVAHGEGLGALSSKNPNSASNVDVDQNGKPFSFGDFQLNVRNGLGNVARASGIDPADPSQWQKADKFSIDYMADHGAQPWKGDAGVKAYNVGANGSWDAPKVAPAVAAMAHALVAGPGAPSQGNGPPMNPAALAHALVNPNIPDDTRKAIIEAAKPQTYTDANNNVSFGSQFQRPQAPVFSGGRIGTQDANSIPTITTGPPNAPQVTPALPGGISPNSTAGGQPLNLFGPDSFLGRMKEQQAATDAHNKAIGSESEASTSQFNNDRVAATDYPRKVLPLQKAIPLLQQLGPQGTGPGSEGFNQVLSFLQTAGVQVGDPDKIKSYDELNKYLTDFVNQNGDHSTNDKFAAAFAGNPSVHISNASALDVAKTAMSMMRYKQQMYQAADASSVPPEKYADFANQYAKTVDPRAFGMDMMTPQGLAELKKELGPPHIVNGQETNPARIKFNQSLAEAQRAGVKPPGQ